MMKEFFKQYFFLLDKQAKKELPLLFLIFFSSSFLDVIGLGLVGAFLLLIVNFNSVLHKLPSYLQFFLLRYFTENTLIYCVGASLACAFIFKGFYGIYAQKRVVLFTARFATRLKMRLITAFQNADYAYHLRENSAYLLNKVSMVDNFSNNAVSTFLNLLASSLVVLGILISLLIVHPFVTLFLSVMMGLLVAYYEMFVKKIILNMIKITTQSGGEINKTVLHAMGGLKEIRVLGKENYFREKFNRVVDRYTHALSVYNALQLIPRYAVECIASVFLVVLALGALIIGVSPVSMIPTLGIFAAACIRLLPTVSQLISQFGQLRGGFYVTKLLSDELQLLENHYKTALNDDSSAKLNFSHISLGDIFFRYPNAKNTALSGVCLDIFRGQSIGLIGPSGSGKSTLMSIILGLLTADQGQLLVNNQPIHHIRAWLNNFAYIPQSIFLLDDTLKRNIAMGTEDDEIDNKKLLTVIEMAQLSDVVADLTDGVDTLIGENGVRLSGGQRQRVALARALYYEREIIVMDEATSSLDNETEREVINSIKRLHGVKTLIVIAHRLTTIEHCDIVYKLEKGKIVAKGTFNEVVRNVTCEI